jgi:hypothetical protein
MPVQGQLWFATDTTAGVAADSRVVRINDDGTNLTTVRSNVGAPPVAPSDIALYPQAGVYFLITHDVTTGQGGSLLMGTIGGGAPTVIENFAANYIVNAVAVDTVYNLVFVGIQDAGGNAAVSGIKEYQFNPITHAVTANGLFTTAALDGKAADPFSGQDTLDVRDFDLIPGNTNLYFTEERFDTVHTQGVYRVDWLSGSFPPTIRVVSAAQFPDDHSQGTIRDIEIGNAMVYFSVHSAAPFSSTSPADPNYVPAQNNIWFVPAGSTNAAATALVLGGLPGGAHFFPGDMVYDASTSQLYVESEEDGAANASGFSDDVIYVFQLDPTGTAGALIHTFAMSPAFGNRANIDALAFDSLPLLDVTGTSSHPQAGGAAVTLLTAVPTLSVPDQDFFNTYFASATVVLSGAVAAGDDSLSVLASALSGTSITASYNSASHTLTLTGYDTNTHYQQALLGVRYTATGPNGDYAGANANRIVTWNISDGTSAAGTNQDTTTFSVQANQPPVAADHVGSSNEDETVSVGSAFLLGGATDPENDTLSLVGVSNATHGSASFDSGTGIVTFIPTPDYAGLATFDFAISDGHGNTDAGTMSITIASVNDAPVLADADVVLAGLAEDSAVPTGTAGTLVSGLIDFNPPAAGLNNASDPDGTSSIGIAIIGSDAHGSLYYSTDGGTSWIAAGPVSNSHALLLAADSLTRVCFRPSGDVNGTLDAAITFRAWDQSSGTNGSYADAGANGGTSAFSSATDSARLNVNAIEDAPVVVNGTTATLAGIVEDDTNPPGDSVANLFGGHYSDAADDQAASGGSSADPFGGIAITANGSSAATGQWQWLNGAAWTNIGAASDTHVILFTPSAMIRFLPATNYDGPAPDLVAHLVDNRIGFSNSDVTIGTGIDFFSTGTVTLGETIAAVNDAPVNHVPASQLVSEDNTLTFNSVNSNLISITDVDSGSDPLSVTLSVSHGTLTLSGTAGLSFANGDGSGDATMQFSGSLTTINAALAGLVYSPAADFNGNDSLSIATDDLGHNGSGTALLDSDSVALGVNAVEDAPVVVAGTNATLAAILEDAADPPGDSVANLFGGHYSDAADDQAANGGSSADPFGGIAITANGSSAATGQWQWLNGATWTNIGAASDTHVILFTPSAMIRFLPAENYNGPAPDLVAHLADNRIGFSDGDVTIGTSIDFFSADTVTLGETIISVNDGPVLTDANVTLPSLVEDSAVPTGTAGALVSSLVDFNPPATGLNNVSDADGTLIGMAIVGSDARGTLYYSTNGGTNWIAADPVSDSHAPLLAADGLTRI